MFLGIRLPSWLGGRQDAQEEALRAGAARLLKYAAILRRDARLLEAALGERRAADIAACAQQCRRRLVMLHAWGHSDLLETFYKQAVLMM